MHGLFRTQQARLTGYVHELIDCNGTAPSSVIILQNWTQIYNSKGDVLVSGMVLVTKAMQFIKRVSSLMDNSVKQFSPQR